ncbi:hypothetical protein [Ralstonia flaminis]|jgi:hypothetical protein|uniref:hypothetical protein n=1 Tax=Ralstonia flaminis TaxID=3058597 RepID=UPI00292EDFAE|nr:hypothetical protein [Ralstonia sp. LMG 18101]
MRGLCQVVVICCWNVITMNSADMVVRRPTSIEYASEALPPLERTLHPLLVEERADGRMDRYR